MCTRSIHQTRTQTYMKLSVSEQVQTIPKPSHIDRSSIPVAQTSYDPFNAELQLDGLCSVKHMLLAQSVPAARKASQSLKINPYTYTLVHGCLLFPVCWSFPVHDSLLCPLVSLCSLCFLNLPFQGFSSFPLQSPKRSIWVEQNQTRKSKRRRHLSMHTFQPTAPPVHGKKPGICIMSHMQTTLI